MNSLSKLRETVKKVVIALGLVSTLAIAIFAQKVEPQSQGKHYGEPGFRGEAINLNVVNADIRDILNYITEQYGINFVIDSSVNGFKAMTLPMREPASAVIITFGWASSMRAANEVAAKPPNTTE